MKCRILFPAKNKENISKCRLLKILPRVLSVNNKRKEHLHLSLIKTINNLSHATRKPASDRSWDMMVWCFMSIQHYLSHIETMEG